MVESTRSRSRSRPNVRKNDDIETKSDLSTIAATAANTERLGFSESKSEHVSTLPVIHNLKIGAVKNKHTVLILAGTHGNEPGPAVALDELLKTGEINKLLPDGNYNIVPYVNIDAINKNMRHTALQNDINRSYYSDTDINQYLLPFINTSSLIIDFHEAWGYHKCSNNESHGQTLNTNNVNLLPIIENVCYNLNKTYTGCDAWTAIYNPKPDKLYGSLEQYTYHKHIPYILVEIAGVHDIVSLDERANQTKMVLEQILRFYDDT